MDGVYKLGKVLAMLAVGFAGLMTVRDRFEAVPVLQKDVVEIKAEQSEMKERLAYLVGGMESLTGRKFKPTRNER